MDSIHDGFRREGLVRPEEGRVLGGVCAGLGRRFGIEPWPARLLFIVLTVILPGSPILIYPALWVAMPSEVQKSETQKSETSVPAPPQPVA